MLASSRHGEKRISTKYLLLRQNINHRQNRKNPLFEIINNKETESIMLLGYSLFSRLFARN